MRSVGWGIRMVPSVVVLFGCPAEVPVDASSESVSETSGTTGDGTSSESVSLTAATASTSSTTASTSTTDVTSTTDASSSSSSESSGSVLFDMGEVPDAPPEKTGCAGVDFLFVIDNSGSMEPHEPKMPAAFPDFMTSVADALGDVTSYHVGVITSDAYTANAAGCTSLGDLVTQTQTQGVCGPFADGMRFATDADNLPGVFPCMAAVGTFGSPIEQPVTGAIEAVSDAKAAVGACNEGFLRDDAILVIVVVTDDPPYEADFDDAHPDTDTSGWYDAIVEAKNGNADAVVVVGFIPWDDISCVPLVLESPNLIGFVEAFGEQGFMASICELDFGPTLEAAVPTIQESCENFVQ